MSKVQKHLDNYQKFLTKGQIPKAIDALEQVVQLMPKDVNHRKKLADLYFRAKRNAEAFSAYEAVARSFSDGGFYLKAIAVYRQMQKIDPTQAGVYERLAELNQKQGLTGQALSEYGELVDILEKNGRHQEVAEVLGKMAKLDPSNLGVRIRVAESYCRSGNKQQGLDELNEISKELRKKGDLATLRKLYELFMRQFPEDLSIQAGMARSLISSGDAPRALQLLQGLLKKAPENIDILGNLANAYRATKDHENERLTFKQLIKQNPDFLDFHKGYARACLDAGSPDKALDHLEQCKQLFAGAEQQKALVSYYEKLQEMLPGEERIVAALGVLYRATGQENRLADLEAQTSLLADTGFGGFDEGGSELETLEEVEELEPLEEVEDLEEVEELMPLEEAEALAPLDEEETDSFELAAEFSAPEPALPDLGAAGDLAGAADLLSDDGEEFAGFDVEDDENTLSGVDADLDLTGGLSLEDAAEDTVEEVLDLDVAVEESDLDLEMEIEFDSEADEPLDVAADDLTESGDDFALDAETDDDLDIDAGLEGELSLDEDRDLDLDLDLGDDLLGERGSSEDDGLDLDLNVGLDAETEDGEADGLLLTEDEDASEGFGASGDELDFDIGGTDETIDGGSDVLADGLELESNDFDPADLELPAATDEDPPGAEESFLETGLETLEDMQASLELDSEGLADAPSFVPERDLLTELEEAEFYIHQGLFNEAEGVCRALQNDFPGAPEIESKLAEIAIHREQAATAPVAEDDEGFFDLASELSNESVFEAGGEMESLDERDLSRLDGILAEFKKGIESQIDQEDTESHFNLGIAYKEMGLLDDAISEFERVMRDPKRVVDCLTLTGICQAEKGDFNKAEETFRKGLEAPEASDEELMSLHYELGIIYEASNRRSDAAQCFSYVAERHPGFRDVDRKLEALSQDGGGSGNGSPGSSDNRISFV